MGEMTFWDQVRPWIRHPLSTAAATIAFRYCEKHGLEIRWHPGAEVGSKPGYRWSGKQRNV